MTAPDEDYGADLIVRAGDERASGFCGACGAYIGTLVSDGNAVQLLDLWQNHVRRFGCKGSVCSLSASEPAAEPPKVHLAEMDGTRLCGATTGLKTVGLLPTEIVCPACLAVEPPEGALAGKRS